jgi:hypothetical protein
MARRAERLDRPSFRDVGGAMLVAGIDNLPLASSMARYRLTLARCQAPRGCGTNRQTQLRADAPGRCAEEKQRADDCDAAPAIIRISGARAFCPSVALTVLDHWATAEPTLARVRFSRFKSEILRDLRRESTRGCLRERSSPNRRHPSRQSRGQDRGVGLISGLLTRETALSMVGLVDTRRGSR